MLVLAIPHLWGSAIQSKCFPYLVKFIEFICKHFYRLTCKSVYNSSMAKTNRHRLTASTARHRIAMGLQDPDRLAWVPGEPACSEISGICSNQAGKRWTLLLPRPQQPRAHKTRWCCIHRELKTVARTGREKYRPLETGASSKLARRTKFGSSAISVRMPTEPAFLMVKRTK